MRKLQFKYFAQRKITNIKSLLIGSLIVLVVLIVSCSSAGFSSTVLAAGDCTMDIVPTTIQPSTTYIYDGKDSTPRTSPKNIVTDIGTFTNDCGQTFIGSGGVVQMFPNWAWSYKAQSLSYGMFNGNLVQNLIAVGWGAMTNISPTFPANSYYVKCFSYMPNVGVYQTAYIRWEKNTGHWVPLTPTEYNQGACLLNNNS